MQSEARSLAIELGIAGAHLPRAEQERRAEARRVRKQRLHDRERLALGQHRPFHSIAQAVGEIAHRKHCQPGRCVAECIHYQRRGDWANVI